MYVAVNLGWGSNTTKEYCTNWDHKKEDTKIKMNFFQQHIDTYNSLNESKNNKTLPMSTRFYVNKYISTQSW